MDKKQFLQSFREAVREMKPKLVLENDHRLRFIVRGDGIKYCPITLLCINQKGIYYSPSYGGEKSGKSSGNVGSTLR